MKLRPTEELQVFSLAIKHLQSDANLPLRSADVQAEPHTN